MTKKLVCIYFFLGGGQGMIFPNTTFLRFKKQWPLAGCVPWVQYLPHTEKEKRTKVLIITLPYSGSQIHSTIIY